MQGGLRKTRQRLRIDPMQVSVILGGEEDPAASAETYGWISAAVWTFMPRLEELMRIPDPYIHLDVDYNARETRAEGEIGLFFQIRDLFAIGFAFGIPALKWLLRWKKEKKLREAAAQAEQAQTVQKTEETDGAKTPENDKKMTPMKNNERKNNSPTELMEAPMSKIRDMVDSNTIIGEPIQTPDGVTLIPVSRLSFGFGCGGGDYGKQAPMFGGASTAGVKVEPVAFLVVKDGATG